MTKFLLNHLFEIRKHLLYLAATNFIPKKVHIVQQFIDQIIIPITTVTPCHHRYSTQPTRRLHKFVRSLVMAQLIGECIEQYIAVAQPFRIFIGLSEISG